MFEVGFTEILLIMVIALVVLGPERLPKLAADVGRWMGRARSMARQLRSQLDQEVQLEEMLREKPATPPPGSAAGATPAAGVAAAAAPGAGSAAAASAGAAASAAASAGVAAAGEAPEIGAPTDEPHCHGADFAGHAVEQAQPDYGVEGWHAPAPVNGGDAVAPGARQPDAPNAPATGASPAPPAAPAAWTTPPAPAADSASVDER